MFRITCDIFFGDFKPVKPNSIKWSRSISSFTDTAVVKIPAVSMLKTNGEGYERVQTGLQLKEGMKAEIQAGYDGRNLVRFKGFISRVNFTVPLEVECEGYSYQLRKKINFTKSYQNTTVKKILYDLIEGTEIKLSEDIPDIPIDKVAFKDVSGVQVLEWFKEKCLLTAYFNYEVLYVGLLMADPKETVKVRLGWNVIKDSSLKFNDKKEFADVRIELSGRKKDGTKEKAFVGQEGSQVKRLECQLKDKESLNQIIKQEQRNLLNKGYEGSVTMFLEPFVEPGMAIDIDDMKYPERKGRHFVPGVDGEISTSGGRQKVKIGYTL